MITVSSLVTMGSGTSSKSFFENYIITIMITLFHLFLLLLISAHSTATEIRWIPGDDPNDNDPAKTAPKSQKYWDEHNIPKPDYAKTDLEFAEDQGLPPMQWLPHPVITMITVGLALGLAAGLYVKLFVIDKSPAVSPGKRLGSAAAAADEQASVTQLLSRLVQGDGAVLLSAEERARQARLARFATGNEATKID